MGETPTETTEAPSTQQSEFEKLTQIVSAEFLIEEALLEHNVPTYCLKQPQETKQAFLRLLKNLETMNLIAFLRKSDNRVVLKIFPKPPVKKSNVLVNWILFFATIATTFATGYMLSLDLINPLIGGATFTIAMMAVLGTHEMGHKITAGGKGVDATPPYFIPGPPPFGTFGAVIMQKSLPPNKDALFDIGAAGPIYGFIVATLVSAVGLTMLIPLNPLPGTTTIQTPILWILLAQLLSSLNLIPAGGPEQELYLHPVTFAGWVGLVVTLLNLLPAAMLDGGHVARSMVGEKLRYVLSALSVVFLFLEGFWPMALFVLFLSMYRHPGPLDDVSNLSTSRKLLAIILVAIFVLCLFII
ncbi:MAG: site-2 protease family protein [Candidatus Bathycorpusculaceae bacterium]